MSSSRVEVTPGVGVTAAMASGDSHQIEKPVDHIVARDPGGVRLIAQHEPVPQDIVLVHAARSKILEIETRRSLLVSLLEFCESFGANTRRILMQGDVIDLLIAEAVPQYLDLEFEEMLETYVVVEEMLEKSEEDAVELKNRTLIWVYIIEWLAVSGTGMACAFLLWTLMIRRRLYREVRVTRIVEAG